MIKAATVQLQIVMLDETQLISRNGGGEAAFPDDPFEEIAGDLKAKQSVLKANLSPRRTWR